LKIEAGNRSWAIESSPVNVNISGSTLDVLRRSMLAAVEGEDGTGRGAKITGVSVAGKTGTAQNPHGDDHAWFVCFAPYDDPEIGMCVLFENSGHGAEVAVPAAHRLLLTYFGSDEPGEVADTR
jgi:cell division protein FtsI/penicillin-binding protein 2